MARRNQHSKEELRNMIIVATELLIDGGGMQKMSTRKIASEIGYTVGTLYLFFKNLDELILTVNARTLDSLFVCLKQCADNKYNAKQVIIAMGHAYVEFAMLYPQRWRMVFEHSLPETESIPDWFEDKVSQLFTVVEMQIASFLSINQDEGSKEITEALWCGVHGICALSVTNKIDITTVDSIQKLTDSLINNFLTGLERNYQGSK